MMIEIKIITSPDAQDNDIYCSKIYWDIIDV